MDSDISLNLPGVLLEVLASIGNRNILDSWRVYANKDCTNVVLKFKPLEDQPLHSPPQQGLGIKYKSASKRTRDLHRAEQNRLSLQDSGITSTPFFSSSDLCHDENSASQDHVHDDVCSQGASASSCITITDTVISANIQPSEKDLPGNTGDNNTLTLCASPIKTNIGQTKHKSSVCQSGKNAKSGTDEPLARVYNFAGQHENRNRNYDGYRACPVSLFDKDVTAKDWIT